MDTPREQPVPDHNWLSDVNATYKHLSTHVFNGKRE